MDAGRPTHTRVRKGHPTAPRLEPVSIGAFRGTSTVDTCRRSLYDRQVLRYKSSLQRTRATSRTKATSKRDEQTGGQRRNGPGSSLVDRIPFLAPMAGTRIGALPNQRHTSSSSSSIILLPRCVRALHASGRQRHMHARAIHG
jgi:hypothetical protein